MTEAKRQPWRPNRDVAEVKAKLERAIAYYALHQTGRVTQKMILAKAVVAKSTLHEVREHDDIAPLVEQMQALTCRERNIDETVASGSRAEREAAKSKREAAARERARAADERGESVVLDKLRIAKLYGEQARVALHIMGTFVGKHRRLNHVSALPATVGELVVAVRRLQGVLVALEPLHAAWLDLPDSAPGAAADTGEGDQGLLDLDLRMPGQPADA